MEREIFADGRAAGTLRTEPDGADTCFSLSCRLGPGLWRLWAEGTAGRLLLGTLEGGGPVSLRRRFSDRLVRPVGTVVRGLAEEVGAARADAWRPAREVPSFPAAAALPEANCCFTRSVTTSSGSLASWFISCRSSPKTFW